MTDLSIQSPPGSWTVNLEEDPLAQIQSQENREIDLYLVDMFEEPHKLSLDLNQLVRDMNLSRNQGILTSMVKGWNLLAERRRICAFRSGQYELQHLFSE